MIGLGDDRIAQLKTALCRTLKGEPEATGAYHTTRCEFAPIIKIQFNLIGPYSFKIYTATVGTTEKRSTVIKDGITQFSQWLIN